MLGKSIKAALVFVVDGFVGFVPAAAGAAGAGGFGGAAASTNALLYAMTNETNAKTIYAEVFL